MRNEQTFELSCLESAYGKEGHERTMGYFPQPGRDSLHVDHVVWVVFLNWSEDFLL